MGLLSVIKGKWLSWFRNAVSETFNEIDLALHLSIVNNIIQKLPFFTDHAHENSREEG
jgi:hypothetical protein